MSARSRAIDGLARHFEALRDGASGDLDPKARPVYNAWESWGMAADMARRTADDETWRTRIDRLLRPRH